MAKARQGVCLHRMEELGEAGRLSAEIHLERNPGDRTLAVILEQARQSGWGVVVAHTGTVRGFIFSPEKLRTREPAAAERFLKSLDRGPVLRIWTLSRPVSCSGRIAVDRVPPPFPQRADGVVT